jgi:hypothetical protein
MGFIKPALTHNMLVLRIAVVEMEQDMNTGMKFKAVAAIVLGLAIGGCGGGGGDDGAPGAGGSGSPQSGAASNAGASI